MTWTKGLLIGLGGVALGLAAGTPRPVAPIPPDDMVSALPAPYYTTLWENETIRLVEHRLEAGEREPMHHHPKMVAYFLETATIRVTEANGAVSEPTLLKGGSPRSGRGRTRSPTSARPRFIRSSSS